LLGKVFSPDLFNWHDSLGDTVTPSLPDKLTLEFLEGPMTGKIVNTYTEVPWGTKVVSECDMRSQIMDDKQLEGAVRQNLTNGFEEDLRYLKKNFQ